MEIIRQYSIYVYIPLIAAIIAMLVIVLMKLFGILKHLKEMNPKFESIMKNAEEASAKADRVNQSKDSFSFMLALWAIFTFGRDVRKNRKHSYSLTNSIAKAAIKNSNGLKRIRV